MLYKKKLIDFIKNFKILYDGGTWTQNECVLVKNDIFSIHNA